jgi:hypothetical protein
VNSVYRVSDSLSLLDGVPAADGQKRPDRISIFGPVVDYKDASTSRHHCSTILTKRLDVINRAIQMS